jgi:hypothetical protein
MGVLTEAKADLLIDKIGADRISTMRGLELLARVMARSESTPEWLERMLVELAGRNHRGTADGPDARGLQTMLSQAYPQAGARRAEAVDETAEADIRTLPERAIVPLAAAA